MNAMDQLLASIEELVVQDKFKDAIAAYTKIIGQAPEARLYTLRGSTHVLAMDYAAALSDFKLAEQAARNEHKPELEDAVRIYAMEMESLLKNSDFQKNNSRIMANPYGVGHYNLLSRRMKIDPLESLAGIECLDVSEQKVFVRASIDTVSKAIETLYPGTVSQNIYGERTEESSILIYQFKRNPWTTIHNFWPSSPKTIDLENSLSELSQHSSAKVVVYTNINTTYEISYSVYELGQHIETYRYGADQGLSLQPNREYPLIAQRDPFRWVDEFLTKEGIFVPSFSDALAVVPGSGGVYRKGIVKFIKPIRYYLDGSCSTDDPTHNPEYLSSDFERVDSFSLHVQEASEEIEDVLY
jgi:tetratricopeptide (TPR) repeat protein